MLRYRSNLLSAVGLEANTALEQPEVEMGEYVPLHVLSTSKRSAADGAVVCNVLDGLLSLRHNDDFEQCNENSVQAEAHSHRKRRDSGCWKS